MWTPAQVEELIISILTQFPDLLDAMRVNFALDGGITRKDDRDPQTTRDVTVATLSLTDGDVQLGAFMVTVWVKDIPEKLGSPANRTVYKPDYQTIDAMVRAIVDALKGQPGYFWPKGQLFVENIGNVNVNAETKEHFQGIRVRGRLHNTSNN